MAENPSVLVTAPETVTTVTGYTVGVLRGLQICWKAASGNCQWGSPSGHNIACGRFTLDSPLQPAIEGHFTAINDPPNSEYLLGTDRVGRDVLSRCPASTIFADLSSISFAD